MIGFSDIRNFYSARSPLARGRICMFAVDFVVVQGVTLALLGPHLAQTQTWSPFVFVGAPLGPLAGAIARAGQSCCVQNSLMLLGYCLPFVMLAGVSLCVRKDAAKFVRGLALVGWGLGIFGWMAGSLLSLGHALE